MGSTVPTREGSASLSYALAVLEYLEAHGCDPVPVFGTEWVEGLRRAEGPVRLSMSEWFHLLRKASVALGDPAFAVRLASTIKARHLGLLGFLLMSCDSLGAAALILQRYEQLLDSVNAADFHMDGDFCSLTWRPLIESPPVDAILLSMSLWANHARWLTERDDLVADARFNFARPSDEVVNCLQQTFGGQVLFGQALNQMVIPVAYLSLPVVQRNREVHASLRQQADSELTRLLGEELGFLAHLEWVLAQGLEQGRSTLQQTAETVNMAPRTLQDRLAQHGLSFRELLDRVRHRLAEHHLSNPSLSLATVAARLGFSDQSAFQHAYKRWTGQAPGEFRRRMSSPG